MHSSRTQLAAPVVGRMRRNGRTLEAGSWKIEFGTYDSGIQTSEHIHIHTQQGPFASKLNGEGTGDFDIRAKTKHHQYLANEAGNPADKTSIPYTGTMVSIIGCDLRETKNQTVQKFQIYYLDGAVPMVGLTPFIQEEKTRPKNLASP